MNRKLLSVLLVATMAATVIAGCSSEKDSPPDEESEHGAPVSSQQYAELMYACLTEKGWDVELTEFGEFEASFPDDQKDAYHADSEACREEHNLDKPPPPMSRDAASEYFDLMLEAAECLKDLGHAVPEPPSREAFIATMTTLDPSGDFWDPYLEAMDAATSQEEWDEVRRACPQPERPDVPD